MNGKYFSYNDVGYGVEICSPSGDSVWLQGDDYSNFLTELEDLEKVWEEGNPNPDLFDSYEEHLDLVLSNYFN